MNNACVSIDSAWSGGPDLACAISKAAKVPTGRAYRQAWPTQWFADRIV